MGGSRVLLAALAFVPQALCASLSSTSMVTCITTLGTASVVPLPTTSNLRSLTVNSIQPSTFTPTATSTPSHVTTTLTYTEFPTTTTTLPNTEIDTFSTTTTIVSSLLITNTVFTTIQSTVSQTTTTTPTYTVPAPAGFTPAASAQVFYCNKYPQFCSGYTKKRSIIDRRNPEPGSRYTKKRSIDRRNPEQDTDGGAIGARQASDAATVSSSSAAVPTSAYIYPKAVSCTGVVEYFSVTTKVVSTAPAVTTTLPPITDTTSTTETTTITSSVLSTPASTTQTFTTTITTSSLAGTFTSTVLQTSTTTITVQAAQATTYAACQANNLVTQIFNANYPINVVSGLAGEVQFSIVKVTAASSAYNCCVQGVSSPNVAVAYLANTGQCFQAPANQGTCNPGGGTLNNVALSYDSCSTQNVGQQFTMSSGSCGQSAIAPMCQM